MLWIADCMLVEILVCHAEPIHTATSSRRYSRAAGNLCFIVSMAYIMPSVP